MISLVYDIIYNIIGYWYWYHIWYHIWCHSPASMISRTYDIIGRWCQSKYHKLACIISEISSMRSYMISRCVYPPPKTRLVERCGSRALQVQVQHVQNRRRWSGVLLDPDQQFAMSCVPVRHPRTLGPPPSPTVFLVVDKFGAPAPGAGEATGAPAGSSRCM